MKRHDNDSFDGEDVEEPPFKRARVQPNRYDELMAELSGSNTNSTKDKEHANQDKDNEGEGEEEEDPLDAFMKQNDAITAKQKKMALKKEKALSKTLNDNENNGKEKEKKGNKKKNLELDEQDPLEAYLDQLEKNPESFIPSRHQGNDEDDSDEEVRRLAKFVDKREQSKQDASKKHTREEELEYDEFGNIITPEKERMMEHLKPIDYSRVFTRKFKKNFYNEHEQVSKMTNEQLKELLNKFEIEVIGNDIPKPVVSFAHFGFDEKLMNVIIESKFVSPTPIQCQAIPCIMSGRDVLGLAKTGSGKTAAFLWPAIGHILDQEKVDSGEGPIAIILAPTRELAEQIYFEAKKFVQEPYHIRVLPLYGGMQMHQQKRELGNGIEMVIATPGRLIDMLSGDVTSKNSKQQPATNCFRTTYLVIDEADKMFSLGFESQIRSIVGQIRPEKQVCLFSATMNKKVEMLARDILNNYIRINIGNIDIGNKDVRQIIQVLNNDELKWQWLNKRLNDFIKVGLVLVFCNSKKKCEILKRHIINDNKIPCGIIHGDKLQFDRENTIKKFKEFKYKVLVSTDVLARGLDISDIKTVINYDCAYNMDAHIHRIGRTGRAGSQDGIAYTLLTPMGEKDRYMAPQFVKAFEKLGLPVSLELRQMAGMGDIDLNASILNDDKNSSNDNNNNNEEKESPKRNDKSRSRSGDKHVRFGKHSYKLNAAKQKEFTKHGFKVGDTNSIAMSFAKTFTKGSSNHNDNNDNTNDNNSNNNNNDNVAANTNGNDNSQGQPTARARRSRFADKI